MSRSFFLLQSMSNLRQITPLCQQILTIASQEAVRQQCCSQCSIGLMNAAGETK